VGIEIVVTRERAAARIAGAAIFAAKGRRFGAQPRGAVDDEDRRYWLVKFDDETICELATFLTGRTGSVEAEAVWRRRRGVPAGEKGLAA
jgi:hypothetical protein